MIKHMPWLEELDLVTVTDAERAKARRVTRPTFDATQPPPPQLTEEERRAAAERERERAEKAERRAARALAPIKRRVLEKRILLRPHWAEDDRRKRGLINRAKFEQVLRIYALWPERDRDVKALVATYAAGDDDMEYVRFCKDCLLYTSPSPRDQRGSRMPSSA